RNVLLMIAMGMLELGMALALALVTLRGLAQSMISLKHSLPGLLVRSAVREHSEAQTCATILLSPLRKLSLAARKKSSYLDGSPVLAARGMVRNLAHQLLVVPHAREQAKFAACNSPFLGNSSMSQCVSAVAVKVG